jgi:hypothetical protein
MRGDEENRTLMGTLVTDALEREVAAIERVRDALPESCHLQTLCNMAVDRLRLLVDGVTAPGEDDPRLADHLLGALPRERLRA